MNRIEEILTERAKVHNQMVALNEKAESEKRGLNADEKEAYDKMYADFTSLKERADRATELETSERQLGASRTGRIVDNLNVAEGSTIDSKAYRSAMNTYLRTGSETQLRAIGSTVASSALLPIGVAADVANALNRGSVVRQAGANIIQASSNTDIPISSAVLGAATSEASSFNSSEPTYTAFTAKAWKYTAKALLSDELLIDAGFDVEGHLSGRLLDGIAQKMDNDYVVGAGSGSSVSTGLIGSSGATSFTASILTAPDATNVFNWYYAVPTQYRNDKSFAFIMNDLMIASIAQLGFVVGGGSDVTIRVPFMPALTPGTPDTLFGKPVYSSAAVTNTFAANALMGVAAAMKYYQIVDRTSNQFAITRLNELYAETGQVMFLGQMRTDGKFLVADAGRTYKCSAS